MPPKHKGAISFIFPPLEGGLGGIEALTEPY